MPANWCEVYMCNHAFLLIIKLFTYPAELQQVYHLLVEGWSETTADQVSLVGAHWHTLLLAKQGTCWSSEWEEIKRPIKSMHLIARCAKQQAFISHSKTRSSTLVLLWHFLWDSYIASFQKLLVEPFRCCSSIMVVANERCVNFSNKDVYHSAIILSIYTWLPSATYITIAQIPPS